MEDNINDADVVLNRLNVALARSQRIVNSWLPQKTSDEDEKAVHVQNKDEDFKPMAEDGGIGSNAAYDDDSSPIRALQRKKLAHNDKLLEQLLGKKAAQAHRKSQETRKSMSAAKHAAPKSLVNRQKSSRDLQSEDDEEAGRSAVFKSRKSGKGYKLEAVDGVEDDAIAVDKIHKAEPELVNDKALPPDKDAEAESKRSRKKTTYLDELLAQKANKKTKIKKQKHSLNS